jgi:hypothetical protein
VTWWGWIIFAAYWLVAIWMWRIAAYVVAHDMAYGSLGSDDIAIGILIGAFAAALWPLVGTLYVLTRNDMFLRAPRAKRLAEREARIAALERELNIR